MINVAVQNTLKKSMDVMMFKDKNINPSLYILLGISFIQGLIIFCTDHPFSDPEFSNGSNPFLSPEFLNYLKHLSNFSFLWILFKLFLMWGVDIQIIQIIMRDKEPTLNIFKLIFRKEMLTYLGISIRIGLIFFGFYILLGILLIVLLKMNLLNFLAPADLIKQGFRSYFLTHGTIIIAAIMVFIGLPMFLIIPRYLYTMYKCACGEKIFLEDGIKKIKGHYKSILLINFITCIPLTLLILIQLQIIFNNKVIHILAAILMDYSYILPAIALSYYFKNYVENNSHDERLILSQPYAALESK